MPAGDLDLIQTVIQIDPEDFKNLTGAQGPLQPSEDEHAIAVIIKAVAVLKNKYLSVPEIRKPLHTAEGNLFVALDRMTPKDEEDDGK